MRQLLILALLAVVVLSDAAAEKKAYAIWGASARTRVTRRGGTKQTMDKCVGFVSPFNSMVEVGCGSTWEKAFTDAKAKHPEIPIP